MSLIRKIISVSSKPFDDQKPGTSGLRKPVETFQQAHYTENFLQSIIDVVLSTTKNSPQEVVLVIGGDGRYYSKTVIEYIIRICAANKIGQLLLAQNGIMSTPAVSAVIRARNATGAIILTASHNPGGPDGDFGIKYNCEDGGPAPDWVTNKIYTRTKNITQYKTLDVSESSWLIKSDIDISKLGSQKVTYGEGDLVVEVIDSVKIYQDLLKTIFDFDQIRQYLSKRKILIDAMNGVMGPYVKRILIDELGAPEKSAIRCEPLEDFGGHHPDPNLTYAANLVDQMKSGDYDFGAAFDGDGDRNMILGQNGFFVTPSDSLAVLADNLDRIPYFQKNGVHGFARSMPTSRAVDRVAEQKNQKAFETPTGWKYFGNLMNADMVSLCGEESFGTGSNHIREKDGLWAVLAWLSILSSSKSNNSVQSILVDHWSRFGRYFYARYDYENCDSESCNKMMNQLKFQIETKQIPLETRAKNGALYRLFNAYEFEYEDPVTKELSTSQGLVLLFNENSARVMFRLSGTGSTGATVRLYLEQHEPNGEKASTEQPNIYTEPLGEVALKISDLKSFTSRDQPTVIT